VFIRDLLILQFYSKLEEKRKALEEEKRKALFLPSFIFPLLFRHCFISICLAHVVSSLAYPNLLGTKKLGCCCCCCCYGLCNGSD
jgi:hypothetical protein